MRGIGVPGRIAQQLARRPENSTGGFDLSGAGAGPWDLEVAVLFSDPATLPGGLTVRPPLRFNRLGTWGGPVFSAQIVGNLAYLARGSDMVILDVTDPANMVELSVTDMAEVLWTGGTNTQQTQGHPVIHVAVQGDYAFVCAGSGNVGNGLHIFDVSDPSDPQLVVAGLHRSSTDPTHSFEDVSFYGNVAYAHDGNNRYLYALDVSDPYSLDPATLGLFSHVPIGGLMTRPVIIGDYLYAYGWMTGDPVGMLKIFDLSVDPFAPTLVGSTPLYLSDQDEPTGLAVDGGFAYVTLRMYHTETADDYGALETVDVSNPAAPVPTDLFVDLSFAAGVAVAGGVAYVADWEWCPSSSGDCPRVAKGLAVFDVATSPGHPALVGELLTHGAARGVAVDGTTVYVLDDGEGVIAVDATDPANPTRLGTYASPAWMQSLAKEGDLLYVSDFWNGVTALDVSDPRHPVTVSVHQTGSEPTGQNGTVAVQDGIAYLAAGYNGIEVVDFFDPANPVLIGGFQDPGAIPDWTRVNRGLAVKDDVLIASPTQSPWGNVWVLDVFDPANPIPASTFVGTWKWWAMTDDFLAFGVSPHGSSDAWFGIVKDLLDPYNPLGENPPPLGRQFSGNMPSISFDGNRFCTGLEDGSGTVYEYALSPTREVTVTPLGTYQIVDPKALTLDDGIMYVHSVQEGLLAIDASDPAAGLPVMAARGIDQGYCHSSMLADGRYLYVGSWDDGFNSSPRQYAPATGMAIYQMAVHGDADGDSAVELADYAAYQRCFGGPDLEPADPDCAVMDFDEDDDVDSDDLPPFLLAWGQPGLLWASSDPAEFTAYVTAQGLTQTAFEDFEEAVMPGESTGFDGPLDEFTDNGIFSPGDIPAGLTIQPNEWGDAAWSPYAGWDGLSQVRAVAPPWNGATSQVVTQDDDSHSLDLIFAPALNVTAVGFDTVTFDTDRPDVQIMVFDTANNLLRTYSSTPGSAEGEFFGVWSHQPIGRINLWAPDGVGSPYDLAGADNIQMWSTP